MCPFARRWQPGGYESRGARYNIPGKKPLNYIVKNDNKAVNSYGHVLKYTGIFGGVQVLNILIGLVRNKAVALLLGPAGMGLASLYNTIASFVSQGTGFGISLSAIRHISEIFDSGDEERTRRFVLTVRAWSLVAALLGAVVCIAAAPLICSYVFDGEAHTLEVMCLAPMVALTTVTSGEMAILKGARRLRQLAVMQVWMVLAALVIAVPVYWKFRAGGIVPVLLLTAAANAALTLNYSYRLFPLRLGGAPGALGEGVGMVRLGVAFILSSVFGVGAEMVVRSFLNATASLDAVGLYNAGYMLTVTYAGMVFSAMEADFFPRLSAVNHDADAVALTVNRQIEVSLLILSPMLTAMMLALPVLLPLLFSGKFAPVVGMAQAAVLSMYARALLMPVTYITLAKGHSRAYIVTEGISAVGLVVAVIACFSRWGLTGAGFAIVAANLLDLIVILVYAGVRYRFRLSPQVLACAAVHIPLGIAAYAATCAPDAWLRICGGAGAVAISTALSLRTLYKKTSLWNKLKEKFLRK